MTRLHRPYARKRGAPPSVTTVLGVLAKDGLSWAAARETALFAVNHPDQWADLPEAAAVDRLYKHHRGLWDHRAALGSLVHSVNEAWAHGEEADLETMVDQVRQGSHIWARMPADQVLAEAGVMVDGLEAFWDYYKPDTISAEDVVRYPNPAHQAYIGQSDWRARIDGVSYLLDLKTTSHDDPTKALYFSDWRLQLAAYRHCTEIVDYDDMGDETGTRRLPPADRCAIVHIRAGGGWQLIPVQAGQTEHNIFLRLRDIYSWLHGSGKDCGTEDRAPRMDLELPDTEEAMA